MLDWILSADVEEQYQVNDVWRTRRFPVPDIIARSKTQPDCKIMFLQAKKTKTPSDFDRRVQIDLSSRYSIPKWLWCAKEQDYNGYFYSTSNAADADSDRPKHVSVFRFMIKYVTRTKPRSGTIPEILYDWHVLSFVVHWVKDGSCTLLCFNVPATLRDGMQKSITTARDPRLHPFAFHALVLEQVVELYDHAIWQFRDFVRQVERHRPTLLNQPNPDYIAMHELARHTMHCSEVLTTALNVMEHMLAEYVKWPTQLSSDSTSIADSSDPGPSLCYHKSLLQFMLNRSVAVENRLKNEIELSFHITAQHTNNLSTQIADATKADGSALKTISVLGLFLLPGTFVSGIFSMSFFDGTSGGAAEWSVSGKFWIYWAVTLPLTMVTVGLWWYCPASKWRSNERIENRNSKSS